MISKKFIKSCIHCQINKVSRHPTKAPMEITSSAKQPFEKIFLDIVGPLPITENGNRFILTFQDDLTKFSYAQAITNHFKSELMKEVNSLFKIRHITTSPYHPQSNGALERSHSTLKDYLKHFINKSQTNWDEFVITAMFSYNTCIHSTTHYTPYELVFANKAILPHSITNAPDFRYSYENYHQQLKLRLNKSFDIARSNIIKSKEKSKIRYDTTTNHYNIGDFVLVLDKSNKPGLNKKLSPTFKGPYEIIRINENQTVTLKIKNKFVMYSYHKNLLKLFVADSS
jgi:hypothetical protein